MVSRRDVAAAFFAMPLSAALAPEVMGNGDLRDSIADFAGRSGRGFGVAARHDRIAGDARLAAAIVEQCSTVTPEFDMNWTSIEPREGERHYAPLDGLADYARDHGLALRGHTLLWELGTPGWAQRRIAAGDWALVAGHLSEVMRRYPQVGEWEVVNEAIDTETGDDGYRRTGYLRGFGPDYIARAMAEARRIAPRARLLLNDYSLEYGNRVDTARRRQCLRIVERLKRDGLIDAVGLQAHLELNKGPLNARILRQFVRDLAGLGIDVVVTELDVKENDRTAPLGLRDSRVAAEVATFLDVVLAEPTVRGLTTWGFTDRDSWLQQDQFAVNTDATALNRGLPLDARLHPKPFFWILRDAFRSHGGFG